MAYTVRANNTVETSIGIINTGQRVGTFRVSGIIVLDYGVTAVQTFYNKKGFSFASPGTQNDKFAFTSIAPKSTAIVKMYSDIWAGGDPLYYSVGQIFDVLFSVTIIETGITYKFRGENAFVHAR